MDKATFNTVNPYYLDNVMKASDKHEVVASEDIHNAAGMKLVAKGQRIDEEMRERLIRFKLRQPLECNLTVNAGVGPQEILAQVEATLDRLKPLSVLFKSKGSLKKVLSIFKDLHFDQMGSLLLSMQSGIETLPHSVLVSLLGVGLSMACNQGTGMLAELAMAGLLHDVGELYINPEYLKPHRKLFPDEWKHIAVHPRIGQMVIGEIAEWHQAIAVAIGEHHERANGFGYPRKLLGKQISELGKVLLTSEALSGMLTKDKHPVKRAFLGAKLIPGEYPFELVSMIACIASDGCGCEQGPCTVPRLAELFEISAGIAEAIDTALENLDHARQTIRCGSSSLSFLGYIDKYLLTLRATMDQTGLSPNYHVDELKDQDSEQDICREMEVMIFEIKWRLDEILRQIALQESELEEGLKSYLNDNVAPSLTLI